MKTLVKLTLECLSVPYDDNVMELKSDDFKGAGKTNYINASPIAFENCAQVMKNCCLELRYESSTLILYKELSSPIFQSCLSVSQASVTPVQISTLCNI